MKTFLILTLSLSISGTLVNAYASQQAPNAAVAPTAQKTDAIPPGYVECPKPSAIHKNPQKQTWSAQGGWRSYETSFAMDVGKFLGAQWEGVNLGYISCIYQPNEKLTFPIILHYNRLTYTPVGGKWGNDLGGYIDCKSTQSKDCIFEPRPTPKAGNIYEEAGTLKGQAQPELGF